MTLIIIIILTWSRFYHCVASYNRWQFGLVVVHWSWSVKVLYIGLSYYLYYPVTYYFSDFSHFTGWRPPSASLIKLQFLRTNANMVWCQRTFVTNYVDQQTLNPDNDYVLPHRRTRLSTVGDRTFPVAAARLWNSLPSHIAVAPSLYRLLSS